MKALARSSVLVLVALAPQLSAQTTWFVDVNGTPPGSGTQSDPYTSIQYALFQGTTLPGDTVRVAPGTYVENISFLGKDLLLTSEQGPLLTVIDGARAGTVVSFRSGESSQAVLRGFKVTNGSHTVFSPPQSGGGGILCIASSPTIRGCIMSANGVLATHWGGGAYLESSASRFEDCLFELNTAHFRGAGAYAIGSAAVFVSCTFDNNGWVMQQGCATRNGAGAYTNSASTQFISCTFSANTAIFGGGLFGPATVLDSTFTRNLGQFGGGANGAALILNSLFLDNDGYGYLGEAGFGGAAADSYLEGCMIVDNRATQGGGVWHCTAVDSVIASNDANDFCGFNPAGGGAYESTLEGCLVTANKVTRPGGCGIGGGVYGGSATRCTIVDNTSDQGAGASGTLTDCIVWGNLPAEVASNSVVTYSDVQGGFPGTGNLSLDPEFDTNFHLQFGSPCMDTGDPASPRDLDGSRVDMGAFPYDGAPLGSSYCVATANSTGRTAASLATGSPLVQNNMLELRSYDLPSLQFGYYLMSMQQDFIPMSGGSQGNLCLGQPIVRFSGDVLFSGVTGTIHFEPDLTNLPQATVFVPGETWNFQAWYRDNNPGPTSNFTDAVSVTFQ